MSLSSPVKITTTEFFKMFNFINAEHKVLISRFEVMTKAQKDQANLIPIRGFNSVLEYIKFAMKELAKVSNGDVVWVSRRNGKEISREKANYQTTVHYKREVGDK